MSAGQRQRTALARALYVDPFLVVLDEPNSNLDADGNAALARAITLVRARRAIAVVIAHRPSALAGCDQLVVMGPGQIQAIGPKEEVLRAAVEKAAEPAGPPPRFKLLFETIQAARDRGAPTRFRSANQRAHAAFTEAKPLRDKIKEHVWIGSVTVVLLVGGIGGWTATTILAGVVVAPGTLVNDSYNNKVQHPTGVVVRSPCTTATGSRPAPS